MSSLRPPTERITIWLRKYIILKLLKRRYSVCFTQNVNLFFKLKLIISYFVCFFRLETPTIPRKGTYCLKFHYHMYGFQITELMVKVVLVRSLNQKTNSEDGEIVFQQVGEIDQSWHDSTVEIQTYGKSKVIIRIICPHRILKCVNFSAFIFIVFRLFTDCIFWNTRPIIPRRHCS